ncbi:MAG: hypothetical protein NZM43_11075 [Saprospiraceae bacterium]|nr:hypothetical protein [Saprospiraceae bacterium]MDW8484849.1 hypothetical protein [Saprospiraceae bacterium]
MRVLIPFLIGAAMVWVIGIQACHKHEKVDESLVNIEITSPSEGQSFKVNDNILIRANITSTGILHGWAVQIRQKGDNQILFNQSVHDHKRSFNIDLSWKPNLTQSAELILEVFAQVEHDGKKVSKTITFQVHS